MRSAGGDLRPALALALLLAIPLAAEQNAPPPPQSKEPSPPQDAISKTTPVVTLSEETLKMDGKPSENDTKKTHSTEVKTEKSVVAGNGTNAEDVMVKGVDSGAWLRGFYVLIGLSVIVVFYFVVKSVSLRRKRSKARRYGLLSNQNNLEMTPLGAEDDEEDLFDASSHAPR